jgi:hypothetical protein
MRWRSSFSGCANQTGSAGNDRAFANAEAHCAKYKKSTVIVRRGAVLDQRTTFGCRAA